MELDERIKAWKREWLGDENRAHFVLDGVVHLNEAEDCERTADWLERVAAQLRKRPK